jgi:DnaK suppressor protein
MSVPWRCAGLGGNAHSVVRGCDADHACGMSAWQLARLPTQVTGLKRHWARRLRPKQSMDTPYFERLLNERMEALRSEMDRIRARKREEPASRMAGEAPDAADQSMVAVTIETESAQLQRDELELRQVDEALGRIAAGSYGICFRCGKPIERARLEANPAARRHASCQEDHDREVRLGRVPLNER